MFVRYCDICGRSLNEKLEDVLESRQYIMEVRVNGHGDILDIELCRRCKHTMYYLMQNPELLKKHVRDMKLHNRIRYLFKGRLKEDAHGTETGEKHEAQEMADEGPGEAGTEPV